MLHTICNSCWFVATHFFYLSGTAQYVTLSQYFYFWHTKSDPRDLWPMRHFNRLMRKHDLMNILTIKDKTWKSERPGCPGTWMSKRPGCPGTWMSKRLGCPGTWMSWDLEVRKTWMSERPGCPGTWMSGDLDVRDLSVRDLSVQDLDVCESIKVPSPIDGSMRQLRLLCK